MEKATVRMHEGTVTVKLEDVTGLTDYLDELLESGEASSWHEYEGAWEVIGRLGLDEIVRIQAIVNVGERLARG